MAHPQEKVSNRFVLYRGLPWSQKFGYENAAGGKVDMTGWVGRLSVRKTVEAEDEQFAFSTEDGSLLLNAAGEGELKITNPDVVPEDFEEGVGHLVIGPTVETAAPIAYWGFLVQPCTTVTVP